MSKNKRKGKRRYNERETKVPVLENESEQEEMIVDVVRKKLSNSFKDAGVSEDRLENYDEIEYICHLASSENWLENGDVSDDEINDEGNRLEDKNNFYDIVSKDLSPEEVLESVMDGVAESQVVNIIKPVQQVSYDEIEYICHLASSENWLENGDVSDDEINDEVNRLEDKINFFNIISEDLSPEEALESVLSSTAENQAANMIKQAQQAIDEIGPYKYGQRIIQDNKLCYMDSPDTGNCLHIYNEQYWKRLEDDALKQLIYDSLPESIKIAVKGIETLVTNVANYVKREMRKAYNSGRRRFTEEEYKIADNRIVFSNCVYDIVDGKTYGFSHKLPYRYAINCDYIEEDLETPYYDKFKHDATDNDAESEDMFDLMQAYLVVPNRTGKCLFIMSYAKDSGKTSFGEFIDGYFTEDQVMRFDVEHLGGKFSYAGMDHALLVSCLEMPVKHLSKSAVKALKNFTGESKMEIEAKYKNHITARVRFKILMASNGGIYLPVGYSDDAFYRRVIVIPFIRSTPLEELMADMPRQWEKERSAIISKCVRKLHRIVAESKDHCIVFPESNLSRTIKASWTGANLINERFVREALVYTAKPEDAISKPDLKKQYDRYYSENTIDGVDRPMQCTQDELVKLIHLVYPHTGEQRKRRSKSDNPKTKLSYCVTGIAWADGFNNSKAGTNDT